jgi:hypothetical protein
MAVNNALYMVLVMVFGAVSLSFLKIKYLRTCHAGTGNPFVRSAGKSAAKPLALRGWASQHGAGSELFAHAI